MKIQRHFNENHKNKLVEAEVDKLEADAASVVENPAEASIGELADAVIDAVEISSNGEQTVEPAEAKKVAKEAKDAADELDAKFFGSMLVENELTEVLDDALSLAKAFQHQGRKGNANVLITGLPGSSKSATVYDWAASHGINLFYLDAKNSDLGAEMTGYAALAHDKDDSGEEHPKVVKAFSSALAPLERPNSVLFLDELNRQTNPSIRASLLTLVNEKSITGDDEDGRHKFKNLLFTIACINPAVPTDPGAAALNDAERSRYAWSVKYDSNPADAMDYFKYYYTKEIAKLDETKLDDIDDIVDEYVKELSLALTITGDRRFTFDIFSDLEELADTQRTMMNQRRLTDGINLSRGSVKKFLRWIDSGADCLDRARTMFHDILDSYDEATSIDKTKRIIKATITNFNKAGKCSDKLVKKVFARLDGKNSADVAGSLDGAPADQTASLDTEASAQVADDFEDDADLFRNTAAQGKRALSKAEKIQRISSFAW